MSMLSDISSVILNQFVVLGISPQALHGSSGAAAPGFGFSASNPIIQLARQQNPADLFAAINSLSQANPTLDWRNSISDFLALLNVDNNVESRKSLAVELNYTGDINNVAVMDVWLQQQVMNRLAQG